MTAPAQAPAPRGAALFVAVTITLLLAIFVATMAEIVFTENMGTDSLILDTKARYLAESGAEYAIRQLKIQIANNYPLPSGANVVVLSGYVPSYEANTSRLPVIEYKAVRVEAAAGRSTTDVDGTTHLHQLFSVSGRGLLPDPWDPNRYNEVYVNKMLDLDYVPLFQYLAFYNRFDLEMLPGNNATLKGRIHSNRDIYLGAEAGKTLTFNTFSMKSSGTLQRHRKNTTPAASNHYMTGTVQIKRKGAAETAPVNSGNYPVDEARGALKTGNNNTVPTSVAPSGYDSNFVGYDGNGDGTISGPNDLASFANGVSGRWEGSVETAANGVPVFEAPTDIRAYRPPMGAETPTHKFNATTKLWEPSNTDATHVPGYYQQNARLVVAANGTKTRLLNSSQTVLLEMDSGMVTTNLLTDVGGNPVNPLSEKQMFDGREYSSSQDTVTNGMVKVTEIDVAKLNAAQYSGQPIFPTNDAGSMIYAYRTDTTEKDPNGIRLTNGAVLNNKLTFVSEDPVYVKGDFNTVAGGDKGAIIMADAVSLLSNQWNDTKTKDTAALPMPTGNLEFNAAIMCGAYATVSPNAGGAGGNYNGGFENFPRFHEDWSGAGKSVNILGSFVSLFESTYAKGAWVYGGKCYTAPVRNWNFNPKFLNPTYQPPGFPCSVGETRVVWWLGRQMQWWP